MTGIERKAIQSVAIVGASLGGATAAQALRQRGFDGRIILIGDEQWLPYQRPPLSKDYLFPGIDEAAITLRDTAWYDNNRVEIRLGKRAVRLSLADRGVVLDDGSVVRADTILLTTGARPRTLPALEHATNVHYLRTRDDADRLARAVKPGVRLAIVGMGVIGAEVAATASRAGAIVSVVEPAATPMSRTLGSLAGDWLARTHARHGVAMYFQSTVQQFVITASKVRGVLLDSGTRLECDSVVVGIGVDPAVELAKSAGLAVENGIIVDQSSTTSNPHVFAAGDVANQPGFFGGRTRLETFHNTSMQAAAAAAAILGEKVDCRQPCTFWSDQFCYNVQLSGHVRDDMQVVVRGSLAENAFTIFYLSDGVLNGALTVNQAPEMAVAKRMILARKRFDASALADVATPLRSLLASSAAQ